MHVQSLSSNYQTVFTKLFDRVGTGRIHFSSAMTMTGKNEEVSRSEQASYLDIVGFIENSRVDKDNNLKELWRRIIFNICISNTDYHLRLDMILIFKLI
ncbi:HipA domain-containing protein [Chryseobacterium chendengshani]|uniref:HipA domain-containing protein n=1 Tax=Chryseobacterium sp. LJ668 TaxID=2864040 RepID=UPI001C687E28|nr:HipA domain-containing protein [Chryseobacterium sp. LJ668]MBW8523847.1 HipA domain-containing protein [Chryseobacterium sp. LJ668]QYK16790.1 HipA domain-containing protein [Chryseobacterium sp. LJ668]